MTLISIPAAIIILLWLCWPKIKGWFEERNSAAQHRRLMHNHVPTPRHSASVEEWREFLATATADSRYSLRTIVQLCCDFQPGHKPDPKYLQTVQLIVARLRELGYQLVEMPNGRFELQEFKPA